MVSTVKSRPNHYEVLGLLPTASQEEIAGAFARAMSMFGARPVAVAAHIGVAFEVLRDPVKRRAYDRSLGLIGEPEQPQWSFVRQSWAPLIASASMSAPSTVEPHVTAEPEPEAPAEPKPDLFEAPALRERPAPGRVQEAREAGLDAVIADILNMGRGEKERLRKADRDRFDWNRPLLLVGGLLAAAGTVGAVAGLSVTHNEEAAQAEPAVTVGLPDVAKQRNIAAAPTGPVTTASEEQAAWPTRAHAPRSRTSRSFRAQEATASPVAPVVASEAAQPSPQAGAVAPDPLAPEPAAAARPVAASLPLPNTVIARTIERIGYSCGEVASTEADEAPGVFKVTCTSGQTYQATPVHGRYRFRRAGGR